MPDIPLRGADPVNDEFEVGYDAFFERSWLRAAIIGRVLLAIVMLAGLAGLLGRGPFSHRTVADPSGTIKVDYEPIARYGTATQVTLHLDMRRLAEAPDVTVRLSSVFVEPMGFHQVLPQPMREAPDGGGLALTFPADRLQDDAMVRLMLTPDTVGAVQLLVRIGSISLHWQQVVLP